MSKVKHTYMIETEEQFEINSARINMVTGQTSMGYVGVFDSLDEAKVKMADLKNTLVVGAKVSEEHIISMDNDTKLVYFNHVDRTVGCYWIVPKENETKREPMSMEDEAGPRTEEYAQADEAPESPIYRGLIVNDGRFNGTMYQASSLYDLGELIVEDVSHIIGSDGKDMVVGIFTDDKDHIEIYQRSVDDAGKVTMVNTWVVDVEDPNAVHDDYDDDAGKDADAPDIGDDPGTTTVSGEGHEILDEEEDEEEATYALLMVVKKESTYEADDIFEYLTNHGFKLNKLELSDSTEGDSKCRCISINGSVTSSDWDAVSQAYQKLCHALLAGFATSKPKTEPFEEESGVTGLNFLSTVEGKKCGCSVWITVANTEQA